MIDIKTIKGIADALEKNLEKISAIVKANNEPEETDDLRGELYNRVTAHFSKDDGINTSSPLEGKMVFSPRAHALMLETQSLLNVLCEKLKLPSVYLSAETSNGDALTKLTPESADVVLPKAYAVVATAQKLSQLASDIA